MFKKIILLFIILFSITACNIKNKEKLKISVTNWIGYTPILYAKEKGWLDNLNIKILNVVSLSENMYLYKTKNSDAYVGTQFEYNFVLQKDKSLFPIMLLDRSNGGDIVMGNLSIKELQNTDKPIDTYLEIDSINSILLKDFIKKNKLENKHLIYKNHDQGFISQLSTKKNNNPTLIITYVPYNSKLKNNGFRELASTKDNLDLIIVDAMFTTQDIFDKYKNEFIELKILVDKAIKNLEDNPREYYEKIKFYLPETSYEDFLISQNDIIWINTKLSEKLTNRLREANFPTRSILK